MRMETVLDYAAVIENSDRSNPARWKGTLDKLFPAPRKIAKRIHFASAPYTDIPRIMFELRKKNTLSAYCLRFIILTAARSMEARSAFWREINFENKVMLASIERYISLSKLSEEKIKSIKKLPSLSSMLEGKKNELLYIVGQRIGSHHVHGNWPSLLHHYIKSNESGNFSPRDHDSETHINQYVFISLFVLEAMKSFVQYIFKGLDSDLLDLIAATQNEIMKLNKEILGDDLDIQFDI